mgnify:CR=1 FL=1
MNPLALDSTDKLINSLEAKKSTDYKCPGCGNLLRLRGGEVRDLHFYHVENIDCDNESYWHKLYKKVLFKCKSIKTNKQTYHFDRVELEKNFEDIRPDAIGYIGEIPHLIEFWHTHKVGIEKSQKIKKMKCICIEIKVQTDLNSELLIEQFLSQNTKHRNYIYPEEIQVSKKPIQSKGNGHRLKNHWVWNDQAIIYYDYKIPTFLKYPVFYYHQVDNHISYLKQIDAKHRILIQENEWILNVPETIRVTDTFQLILWQRLMSATVENSQKNPEEVIISHSNGSGSIYKFHKETNQLVSWILSDENGELVYECHFTYQNNYQRTYKNSLDVRLTNDYDDKKKQYIWKNEKR